MTIIRIITLFVAVILISLSDTVSNAQTKSINSLSKIELSKVKIQDGVLVIKDYESAEKLSKALSTLSQEEKYEWENKMGYRSLAGVLYESELNDEAYYEQFFDQGFTEDQIIEMIKTGSIESYSKFTQDLIKKGVLTEIKFEDGSIGLDVAITPPFSLRFINADGFSAVDGIIYQYTKDATKAILDGDFSKLEKLKKTYFSSIDAKIAIFDLPIEKEGNSLKSATGDENPPSNQLYSGSLSNPPSGESYNCEKQGCVRLLSSLHISKYWFQDFSIGYRSQVRVYLNNAGYKFSFLKWRRQEDYKFSVNGYMDWGVTERSGCDYGNGGGGQTVNVNYTTVPDYKSLITYDMSLVNTSCFPGGSGFMDSRRVDFNNLRIRVTLEQTDNGETVHPSIYHIITNKNSWDSISMQPAK